jgi:hypothetical protein
MLGIKKSTAYNFFLFLITCCTNGYANICTEDTISRNDTSQRGLYSKMLLSRSDSLIIVINETGKKNHFAVGLEGGYRRIYYTAKTRRWLGNHDSPSMNLVFMINQLNVGFCFQPCTLNPKTELEFNNQSLPTTAKLNPGKLQFYIGYSFDFQYILVEPRIGLSRNLFYVINEDELGTTYSLPSLNGLIGGIRINRYFQTSTVHRDWHWGPFIDIGYSLVNYKKLNANLGIGSFEWTFGITHACFF